MSSGIDGGIGGGGASDQGGGRGGANRKNTKKFGKNLNKLTKAPAAPPVPVISAGGGGSSGSFRGSSSNRNGLLLLSTKSKSSSGIGGGSGGLLASSGTPKSAHDSLLLSAGAGQEGGDPGKRHAAHAWGIGEKKQKEPVPSIESRGGDRSPVVDGIEKSEPVVGRSDISVQQQRPLADCSGVCDVADKVEAMDLNASDSSKKVDVDSGARNGEKVADEPSSDASQPTETIFQPKVKADIESKKTDDDLPKGEKVKDYQVEYMSKLAKERAEKLRLEEEARMAAQKERAAMRLRELEEKRLEERKKNLKIISQERRELSGPSNQVILEPLGKLKKDAPDSSSPGPMLNAQLAEKKNARTLYDPDRPFSSLVGGKTVASVSSNARKDERPLEITKKTLVHESSLSPLHVEQDSKKNDPPPPAVHMVQLSNLDEIDRGGRGEGQGGPRMLFDPSSGSMVAVKSREDPKSTKKPKQKVPQKGPVKSSEEVGKVISRRVSDGAGVESSLRGKQGKGNSRKDEPLPLLQKVKKSLDKTQPNRRKRLPRTRGVLYKLDKSGNYLNADGCNPDNGYGAHLVPGGRVKNPGAHAKYLKQREEKKAESQPSASTNATEGFSFRNDPGFIRHQTDFESQQQKILEDAWASLIENDEPMEESDDVEEFEDGVPVSKSGDDEYAAALAISPSIIGLNFDTIDNMDSVMLPPAIKSSANRSQEDPIDLVKFALGATGSTSVVKSANPFVSPLTSLWGASSPGATNTTYGDLGALTGWTPIPFGETDTTAAAGSSGLNGSGSQASKLHLWGSSALDDGGLGAFGKNLDTRNGAD